MAFLKGIGELGDKVKWQHSEKKEDDSGEKPVEGNKECENEGCDGNADFS